MSFSSLLWFGGGVQSEILIPVGVSCTIFVVLLALFLFMLDFIDNKFAFFRDCVDFLLGNNIRSRRHVRCLHLLAVQLIPVKVIEPRMRLECREWTTESQFRHLRKQLIDESLRLLILQGRRVLHGRSLDDFLVNLIRIFRFFRVRHAPTHELVQANTYTPQISGVRISFTLNDLRCHIMRCTNNRECSSWFSINKKIKFLFFSFKKIFSP